MKQGMNAAQAKNTIQINLLPHKFCLDTQVHAERNVTHYQGHARKD